MKAEWDAHRSKGTAPPTDLPTEAPTTYQCRTILTYVDSYGCLPITKRSNGVPMVYVRNSMKGNHEYHEEIANLCGGHLGSILNDKEQNLMRILSDRETIWIGGKQSDSINEPAGNWYWIDNEQFLELYTPLWNDESCNSLREGMYLLPVEYGKIQDCPMTHTLLPTTSTTPSLDPTSPLPATSTTPSLDPTSEPSISPSQGPSQEPSSRTKP